MLTDNGMGWDGMHPHTRIAFENAKRYKNGISRGTEQNLATCGCVTESENEVGGTLSCCRGGTEAILRFSGSVAKGLP